VVIVLGTESECKNISKENLRNKSDICSILPLLLIERMIVLFLFALVALCRCQAPLSLEQKGILATVLMRLSMFLNLKQTGWSDLTGNLWLPQIATLNAMR